MVIGFFMPLPLAMMIPFMGIQSAVMAKQFGENFQYGKRRISAMSNDEFNKLTPALLQANANAELKAMIPSMQQSIIDMQGFQEFLVKEFIRMVDSLLQKGLGSLLGLSSDAAKQALFDIEHFLHGHPDLHRDAAPTTPAPEPDISQPPPTEAPPGPTIEPTQPPTEVILELGITREVRHSFAEQRWLLKNAQGMVSQPNGGDWKIHSNVNGTWLLVKTIPKSQGQAFAISFAKQSWPPFGGYAQTANQPTGEIKRWFWVLLSKLPTSHNT